MLLTLPFSPSADCFPDQRLEATVKHVKKSPLQSPEDIVIFAAI